VLRIAMSVNQAGAGYLGNSTVRLSAVHARAAGQPPAAARPPTVVPPAPSRSSARSTPISLGSTKECLDARTPPSAVAPRVRQRPCTGGSYQRWRLAAVGDGYFNIVAGNDGGCLDVMGLSTANGAPVLVWRCNGGRNQQWQPLAGSHGYASLVARHSRKCLEARGAYVVQDACSGRASQQWRLATGR
jgi:hypothetical protein